jgi:hypothetical protein
MEPLTRLEELRIDVSVCKNPPFVYVFEMVPADANSNSVTQS